MKDVQRCGFAWWSRFNRNTIPSVSELFYRYTDTACYIRLVPGSHSVRNCKDISEFSSSSFLRRLFTIENSFIPPFYFIISFAVGRYREKTLVGKILVSKVLILKKFSSRSQIHFLFCHVIEIKKERPNWNSHIASSSISLMKSTRLHLLSSIS